MPSKEILDSHFYPIIIKCYKNEGDVNGSV
jgi:hypothetical protein